LTQPVFRFAPSPNGRLHLGHAYSALLNARLAQRWGGRFLLRIEDIDITRCRPEFEQAIYDDLAWLGLAWQRPVRRQSDHFGDYRSAFERLRAKQLVYPCFCSRKDISTEVARWEAAHGKAWPRDPDGAPLYPGSCRSLPRAEVERRLADGHDHAWRLHMPSALSTIGTPLAYRQFDAGGDGALVQARPELWGDAVVVRKEIPTSYHLSVVVDDALQGISHVVRGTDLEAATDLHLVLQALLDLPAPRYHHHGLIRDNDGGKLSKSLKSEALADLRARGVTPDEVRRRLGFASADAEHL